MDELIARLRQGNRRALARLISQVEESEEKARPIIQQIYDATGRAHIVGITGPPGSGKSTLVNELAKALRRHERTVGIVAVDPSSPFTGGAVLGDRVRMRDLAGDPGIFIRSMASRGALGGLARATSNVVKLLDAAGFDVILVETVGAGQAEVDIASAAHTTIVIEAPGMGDEIQSIKAGILEVADVLVVNKADRPGSKGVVRSLQMMLHLNPRGATSRHHGRLSDGTVTQDSAGQRPTSNEPMADGSSPVEAWQVPVLETVATEGQGVEELVLALEQHVLYLKESSDWLAREVARSRQEMERLLNARLLVQLKATLPREELEGLTEAVARRELDPYTAVARMFDEIVIGG